MLLGTLGANFFRNMLVHNGVTRAGKGTLRAGEKVLILAPTLTPYINIEFKDINKMNLNLMVLTQKIIYQKHMKDGAYILC